MRFHPLAILLTLLSLTLAAPADAAVSWVVHGRGFGHGVGMSAYGAYGYALHGKSHRIHPRPLLQGDDDRDDPRAAGGPRPARRLRRRRRLQRRHQRLRPRPRPRARLRGAPLPRRRRAAQLRRQTARRLRPQAARRRQRQGRDRRGRQLPRCPGDGADRERLAGAQRRQRARPRAVRERGDAERGAGLVAGGGAEGSGAGGALDRPHRRGRRQRLRPLQRHPQPGLRGARKRAAADQRGRRRDPRPGGHVRGRGRRDLLLGLLGRPHRERRQRLRHRHPLPGRRPRSLRRRLPAAHLDAEVQRRRDERQAGRLAEGQAEAGGGHQARRLPPHRRGEADRDRRRQHRQRRTAGGRARRLQHLDELPKGRQRDAERARGALSRRGRAESGCRGRSPASPAHRRRRRRG